MLQSVELDVWRKREGESEEVVKASFAKKLCGWVLPIE